MYIPRTVTLRVPDALPDGLLSVSVYSPVSLRTALPMVRRAFSGVVCRTKCFHFSVFYVSYEIRVAVEVI